MTEFKQMITSGKHINPICFLQWKYQRISKFQISHDLHIFYESMYKKYYNSNTVSCFIKNHHLNTNKPIINRQTQLYIYIITSGTQVHVSTYIEAIIWLYT